MAPLRICLFTWLLEQIKTTKVPPKLPKELNLVVPGLYKSLEDRNPEVGPVYFEDGVFLDSDLTL